MKKILIIIIVTPLILALLWFGFVWYAATGPYDHRAGIKQANELIPDVKQFFYDNKQVFKNIVNNETFNYNIEKYDNIINNEIKITRIAQYFGVEFIVAQKEFTCICIYYLPDFMKIPRVVYKEKIDDDWYIVFRTYEPG